MVTKAEKAAELLMQSVVHSKLPILKKSLYYICFPSNRIRTFSNVNFSSLSNGSLFRKKRFEINFFVQRNASKFGIFIEKDNPCSFFRFSFRATLSFTFPKLARLAQSKKGPIYSDSKYVMRISK